MSYCKNLTRKLNGKLRCKIIKQEITLEYCKKCHNFEPKANKSIKKISSHKKTVSKETYNKVLERDKTCRLQNTTCSGGIELHHIIYRSEDINKIDDPDNCIMLCTYHHKLVHNNKKYWKPRLIKMIKED